MIWLSYSGYRCAVSAALANDFVSSAWTSSVTLSVSGEAAIALLTAAA